MALLECYTCSNLAAHNVLLEDDDTAKVTDFGVSQIVGDVLMLKSSNSSVRWSAPEVLKSKVVTFTASKGFFTCGIFNSPADIFN